DHASAYRERATAYAQELREVDAYIHERVAELDPDRRILITSHDAFGYFGEMYGFEVRGLQGISTATEAGTSDVQELAQFVADRRIPAMFVESSVPPRGIEAVREAVRARGFEVRIGGTLYGDALGGPGSGADTYVGMVRANIDTIVEGLTETAPS
ncbi:MAG TPA: zinc ABC transporter substrate-binding protein, partial [Rhodothermales bacterium]